jgi:hypothetical protein
MYNAYVSSIKQFIKKKDLSSFKQDKNYTEVLEHVTHRQGSEYLKLIENIFSSENISEFCRLNDSIGNPTKFEYILKNDQKISVSPTSLRYMYHAHLCLANLHNIKECENIIEIGGGYGGLCLAISHLSFLYDVKIQSYTIIDLDEPQKLQDLYLKNHNLVYPVVFSKAFDYGSDINTEKNFLISNYCLSEIEKKDRDNYLKILFPKVQHGFLVWNITPLIPLGKNEKIEKERPNIVHNNYFVYF